MGKKRKKYDCNRKINGKFWIIIVFFTIFVAENCNMIAIWNTSNVSCKIK